MSRRPAVEPTWLLEGAARDRQSITAEWKPVTRDLIDGVVVQEIANVPKQQGYLTEIYRGMWDAAPVDQVFQVVLSRGGISAWHAHEVTTDRLFVASGLVRIVLYDARTDAPTCGRLNEFRFGTIRPALVTVPPRVWHGLQNLADGPSAVLNIVDIAYDYANPDHWRVPHDSKAIPFVW
jgi:dTDP-4-dehydrorhamnose 3,5-epimerase